MLTFPDKKISEPMENQRHMCEAAVFSGIADNIVGAENSQFLAAVSTGFMYSLQHRLTLWAKGTGKAIKVADIKKHILANLVAKGRSVEKNGAAQVDCYGSFAKALAYVNGLKAVELRSNPVKLIALGHTLATHLNHFHKQAVDGIFSKYAQGGSVADAQADYVRFVSEHVAKTLPDLERVTTGKEKKGNGPAYKPLQQRIAESLSRTPIQSPSEIADAIAWLQEQAAELAREATMPEAVAA